MSLGIVNAIAGASPPMHGGMDAASMRNAQTDVVALKAAGQPNASARAERTERADAVKATPTTAPATIADFLKDRTVSTDVPQYPITGPDKFAKSMAAQNAKPKEADEAEAAGKDAAKAAETGDVAQTEEAVKTDEGVEVVDKRAADAVTRDQDTAPRRDDTAASREAAEPAKASAGAPETASEAYAPDLTK